MTSSSQIWCVNQQHCKDGGDNFSCLAHLAEGRIFTCPYKDLNDMLSQDYHCMDYSNEGITNINEATILNGKIVAKNILKEIKETVELLDKPPCLAVILVGNNPASEIYVRNKQKDCMECGIQSETYHLSEYVAETRLLELINMLNNDPIVSGILVQLPLPKHINTTKVINSIDPIKDVDCFHPQNVGKLITGDPLFAPCTPSGVMELIRTYNIETAGKHAVVLGRSNIVGKPMSTMLLHANCTVTTCHSWSTDIDKITREADILVSAVGIKKYVTADMVKDGAVVIDVAMNRDENNKLCGDVDFETVKKKSSYITPVPGGVGPMTRAMLMQNVIVAANAQIKSTKTI